jgi:hypothetical protein
MRAVTRYQRPAIERVRMIGALQPCPSVIKVDRACI